MNNKFIRLELIYGKENLEKLRNSRVAIFGIGGVGGYVLEALARCGIEYIDLIDNDTISESNINRQIIATISTIGKDKVEVAKQRVLSINENCNVSAFKTFFLPENQDQFDFTKYDYVIDCIDTVTSKIALVEKANKEGCKIISCLGTGNKIDPSKLEVSDIYKTSVCPLAKVLRHELKKRNIKHLKVVYSKEEPIKVKEKISKGNKRCIVGSTSFVPASAGLLIASEVVKDLLEE